MHSLLNRFKKLGKDAIQPSPDKETLRDKHLVSASMVGDLKDRHGNDDSANWPYDDNEPSPLADLGCGICSKHLPLNPRLCSHCQIWNDARHVFRCIPPPTFGGQHQPLNDILSRANRCVICQHVSEAVITRCKPSSPSTPQFHQLMVLVGGPYWLGHDIPANLANSNERSTIRCVVYISVQESTPPTRTAKIQTTSAKRFVQPDFGVQLDLTYDHNAQDLEDVQTWDEPFIDTEDIKTWLSRCESSHAKCQITRVDLPLGFRLLDVDRLCIVQISQTPRFVALSYTWSLASKGHTTQLRIANRDRLRREGALCLGNLPPVIADAFHLCHDLGERYLWVDQLCITQDDDLEKGQQIAAMDRIYCMAAFTIISALKSRDTIGLPGVRGRPRSSPLCNNERDFKDEIRAFKHNASQIIDRSIWASRGWTYQERLLSSRQLIITDHGCFLSCSSNGYHSQEFGLRIDDSYLKQRRDDQITMIDSLYKYLQAIGNYTSRDLTNENDILDAFAGVANVLKSQLQSKFLWGLSERSFASCLLWSPFENGQHTRRRDHKDKSRLLDIPSWSWAAWLGPAQYKIAFRGIISDIEHVGSLVRFHVVEKNGVLRRVVDEEKWFRSQIVLEDFKKLCEIRGMDHSQFAPGEATSVDTWLPCPHNPWRSLTRGGTLDDVAIKMASNFPGSLVFNTTVASLSLSISDVGSQQETTMPLIFTQDGKKIGQMMAMNREFARDLVAQNPVHNFIVICAGVAGRGLRHHPSWASINYHGPDASPWLLHVMMIKPEGSQGIISRIGVGVVEMRYWKDVRPIWETVVLI